MTNTSWDGEQSADAGYTDAQRGDLGSARTAKLKLLDMVFEETGQKLDPDILTWASQGGGRDI